MAKRSWTAVCILMLAIVVPARAQVLNHVRDDAILVLKLNNPQNVNVKVQALAQKLGVDKLAPVLADPLGTGMKLVNLHGGVDLKGEAALMLFLPAPGEREPRMLALLPVADYQQFLANFTDVKKDGEADTFLVMPEGEPVFSEKWGNFAAVSPWKELLQEQPQGLKLTGVLARQAQEKDASLWINLKVLSGLVLPHIQQFKQMLPNLPMQPGAAPEAVAFQRAMLTQVVSSIEQFFIQSQAAMWSLSIGDEAITDTFSIQFDPAGSMGQWLSGFKPGSGSFLAGLPQEEYLAYGGLVMDGAKLWDAFEWLYGEPMKAAQGNAADAKAIADAMAAFKRATSSFRAMSFGVIAPSDLAIGEKGLLQGIGIVKGDAREIIEANRATMQHQQTFMRATGNTGISINVSSQLGAKTIGGVTFDQFRMAFTIDEAKMPDPTAAKILNVMYGKELVSWMGAVDANTVVTAMGVDEARLTSAIESIKQGKSDLAASESVKAAEAQFPKDRIGEVFVSLGDIAQLVMKAAEQMGGRPGFKLPPDLPPVAASIGVEGSVLRLDGHLPTSLVQNAVSIVIQMQAQGERGGRRGPRGPQPPPPPPPGQ